RLHVELAGGVLHPCRSHGEGLQLRIVGGGGHLGPQPPHVLDD
ncbi:HTH cro/C1-type domain-containing protein, partial [Dysosmobacter welbionis]